MENEPMRTSAVATAVILIAFLVPGCANMQALK